MASHNQQYNKKLYDSLLEAQKELLSTPRKAENQHELVTIWTLLCKIEAKPSLVCEWVKYLPPSYASTLHNEALDLVWTSVKKDEDLPAYLKDEWSGSWPATMRLKMLHYARIRANELGVLSVYLL